MGFLDTSTAILRIYGDDLVPSEITHLLGAAPSGSCRKGEQLINKGSRPSRIAKTGMWRLNAAVRQPEAVESQIFEILEQLTPDFGPWNTVSSRYTVNLFCGLFMASSNDGLELSSKLLLGLGQRGISIGFDIYDPTDEDYGVPGNPQI